MGVVTATSLVVASMIGTGVFTTTGFVVDDIPSATGILWCWAVGGLAALCGALAYAELGAAYPQSGGEYHFLSRLMGPTTGFLSAWSSLIVGFSAPLAALALAFGSYLEHFVAVPPKLSGAVLIAALSVIHVWRVSAGSGFQNLFTVGKVVLIAALIAVGLTRGDWRLLHHDGGHALPAVLISPGFAVGLLWVSFSYTGWNAGAYVAGEVIEPHQTLPRALVGGTLLVTVVYLLLNATFLSAAPLDVLAGKVEIGHVAAVHLLGDRGGRVISAIIALGLVSTVSALVVTGPRIYEAVGRDMPRLRFLAIRRANGGPIVAILLQSALALLMMLTARFDQLLVYIGFTLSIFAGLTVCAVFVLRRRTDVETPFRMPGYPATPLLFVALMLWMVVQGLRERPLASLAGLGTIALGWLIHRVSRSPQDTSV